MICKVKYALNTFALAMLVVFGTSCEQKNESKKPNIVYVICDDLGYGDVQFLNPEHGKIPTPNMDKLATEGMSFTDAHGGSSVCTPTRYGVLTGRYAWRSHLQTGVLGGGAEFEPLISEDILTVPKLLKRAGYQTAAMGKWHLGFAVNDAEGNPVDVYNGKKRPSPAPIGSVVPNGPVSRGFDSYLGFHHSASMETVIKDDKVIDNMPTVKMLEFLGDNASEYIEEKSKEKDPFFLYLALNSPHTPIVPSENWKGKSGMGDYCDFVMETDYVVGRVMEALKKNGIEENTLVFLTSDNGCSYFPAKAGKLQKEYGHYISGPFRGSKSDIWEGGHRVPFIAKWPGKIEAGSTNEQLVCLTNLMATVADITNVVVPENEGVDSYSILPLLIDENAKSAYTSVIHHSIKGKFSIRKGKWKLELCPGSGGWSFPNDGRARKDGDPEIQLYDLENDISEQNNVYQQHPELVKELTAELVAIVERGRTKEGEKLNNDVEVDIFKSDK
ncbi:arylsulfatase [Labilibaculum sp.]|uniref:sulfatase family protein n=1 Tax=Labilibaculum sp. TaxID=2060723 RepID=UPI0035687A9D